MYIGLRQPRTKAARSCLQEAEAEGRGCEVWGGARGQWGAGGERASSSSQGGGKLTFFLSKEEEKGASATGGEV